MLLKSELTDPYPALVVRTYESRPVSDTAPQYDPHKNARGAARLWLSQRQWMALLQDAERSAREAPSDHSDDDNPNRRTYPRISVPEHIRCMIRLGDNTGQHGTYLVRARDVSPTGLGFSSEQVFQPRTRCTVAFQDGQGRGMVRSAVVVWCRPVDDHWHDVGVRFDQPIDADWLTSSPMEPTGG